MAGTSFSDGTAAFAYAYTPAGRVLSAARVQGPVTTGSMTNTYDAAGRVASVVRTGPGGGTATYSHTSAGRLSGVSLPTGQGAGYSYNQAGELTAVTPSGVGNLPVVAYGYDPSGRTTSITRGSGATATSTGVTYDGAGQVTAWTNTAGATVVSGYVLGHDTRGNTTKVATTTVDANGAPVTSATYYAYDSNNRISRECWPTGGGSCVSGSDDAVYTYNTTGTRKSVVTTIGGASSTATYSYDAGDRLTAQSVDGTQVLSQTWTPDGQIATATSPTGTRTYTTAASGEVTSVGLENGDTVGYTYDAQGHRTTRTVNDQPDVTWSWDDATGLAVRTGQYDATGALSTAWLADPTSTTGGILAATTPPGTGQWLLGDPFANTTATTSTTTATVTGLAPLTAFGQPATPATGTMVDQPLGFAGQYTDARTGLVDMRARDYDPTTARFTTTDPLTTPVGMAYVNGYTYAFNNPLSFTDVTGRRALGPTDTGWPASPSAAPTPGMPHGPTTPPVCAASSGAEWYSASGPFLWAANGASNGGPHVWGSDTSTSQKLSGGALGAALFGVSVMDDYNNRYAQIADPTERLVQSATREVAVAGAGTAGAAAGYEASTALAGWLTLYCPETLGTTCVAAAVILVGSATIGGGAIAGQSVGGAYDQLFGYGSKQPYPYWDPTGSITRDLGGPSPSDMA